MDNNTFFTIILAIRNVGEDLKTSIENYSKQTYKNFELIIADCNSEDNPIQFINNNHFPIKHIIQNDNGIYDAWNKVLPIAQGEWIIFMGAGDVFYNDNVLENSAKELEQLSQKIKIAYGQIDIIGENNQVIGAAGIPWDEYMSKISKLCMFPHQATFQRKKSFEEFGLFDTNYKIAGDFEMILRVGMQQKPHFFYAKIAKFQFGGTSSTISNREKMIIEWHFIMKKYNLKHQFAKQFFKAKIINLSLKLFNTKNINNLIDLYRILIRKKRRYN